MITDLFDYTQLDSGIRETVRFIRDAGFNTTDSGDGVSKGGFDDVLSGNLGFPHVVVRIKAHEMLEEAHRLQVHLEGRLGPAEGDDEYGPAWQVELSYDPASGVAIIMVRDVNDAMLAAHPNMVAPKRCPACAKLHAVHPIQKDGRHHIEDGFSTGSVGCAFTSGFHRDAWNCQAIAALRQLAMDLGAVEWSHEQTAVARIPSDHLPVEQLADGTWPEEDLSLNDGWVVLSWYKQRGRCAGARFLTDNGSFPLTLERALGTLKQHGREA